MDIKNKIVIGASAGLFFTGFFAGVAWEKSSYDRKLSQQIQETVFDGAKHISNLDHSQEKPNEKEKRLEFEEVMEKLDYMTLQLKTLVNMKNEEHQPNKIAVSPSMEEQTESISPSALTPHNESTISALNDDLNQKFQEKDDNFIKNDSPLREREEIK